MNTRAQEVGRKITYKKILLSQQLCIVPAVKVFEPMWETGVHVGWAINLSSGEPFGMPSIWRSWDEEDGSVTNSFTHFTLNSDEHLLMRRFHRPNEEKRGVAILRLEHCDNWFSSKNTEFALALIGLYKREELNAFSAPTAEDVEDSGEVNSLSVFGEVPELHSEENAQGNLFIYEAPYPPVIIKAINKAYPMVALFNSTADSIQLALTF